MHLDARYLRNQRGIGLPGAIFIITILSLLAAFVGNLSQTAQTSFTQNYNSQKALYAAESGVQIALHRVLVAGATCDNTLSSVTFATKGLETCTADLNCTLNTVSGVDYYSVESVGECGANDDLSRRTVQDRVRGP